MFFSVVKHLGSGRALKKWGKTLDCVSCFPLHFFRALPLPVCFTTDRTQSRLLHLLNITADCRFSIVTMRTNLNVVYGLIPYLIGMCVEKQSIEFHKI